MPGPIPPKPDFHDPHQAREASRYSKPVPSREFLLSLLQQRGKPATYVDVLDELNIVDEDQQEGVRRRLIAMVRDGQLVANRRGAYKPVAAETLVEGYVQGHRDGYGFVLVPTGQDIYLSERQMRRCIDGDLVKVRRTADIYNGRAEGVIVQVLQANTHTLVGRLHQQQKLYCVVPDNPRLPRRIAIHPDDTQGAQPGQVVEVKLIEQPTTKQPPRGEVVCVLGEPQAPGMEIDIALRSHGIPYQWSAQVTLEADLLPERVPHLHKLGRIDLRKRAFVTIDGEDARDFDDAVFGYARRSGGWRLYVAIADVAHYVTPGSELDKEAGLRATSVYFPGHVVPMLPQTLSNGLCSLNPQQDRLVLVCEMAIDAQGEIESFVFYEGVIHSHARLTYTQVDALLNHPDTPLGQQGRQQYHALLAPLQALHALYQQLRQARTRRGSIDFDSVEPRIVFDEQRKIERIEALERNDAHRLIEECMLCANVCAAQLLEGLQQPGLYRVHQGPEGEKLEQLRAYLTAQQLSWGRSAKPSTQAIQQMLQKAKERPDFEQLQRAVLRSMRQAVYQPHNAGHFGLGYAAYTHFTSPIRRYPDLLVHRLIKSVIHSKQRCGAVRRLKQTAVIDSQTSYPYDTAAMLALGEHCSMAERRADEAAWDVIAWLKCEYMQDRVGEVYSGEVSSVTSFGLFVSLKSLFIEGLVHISALDDDYYHYDDNTQQLRGESSGRCFALGDSLTVRVARVDLSERKIDFAWVGQGAKAPRQARKSSKPSGRSKRSGRKPRTGQ